MEYLIGAVFCFLVIRCCKPALDFVAARKRKIKLKRQKYEDRFGYLFLFYLILIFLQQC